MEKVKIKSVINSGKKWQDKAVYKVELEDNRSGSTFEADAMNWKGEMELDIKEGKEYQGKKQLIFNLPKVAGAGRFPQKDYAFEKRRASLESAIETAKLKLGSELKSKEILEVAELYFNFLNKK